MYFNDEQPQHELNLPRYYIAHYPVTVAQFKALVKTAAIEPAAIQIARGLLNHPVFWITWYDALSYCRWLEEKLQQIAVKSTLVQDARP